MWSQISIIPLQNYIVTRRYAKPYADMELRCTFDIIMGLPNGKQNKRDHFPKVIWHAH